MHRASSAFFLKFSEISVLINSAIVLCVMPEIFVTQFDIFDDKFFIVMCHNILSFHPKEK